MVNNPIVLRIKARKTFKIAWEPEFPRKIAFEHFEVKPTPITLINLVLRRKGPLKKQNILFWTKYQISNI